MPGASEEQLREVEVALGKPLPADLKNLLRERNGFEEWFDDVFVMLYSAESIVELNLEHRSHGPTHPGLIIFGSDGSRELFGLDLRSDDDAPVVMIDITSDGWGSAIQQAPSLGQFMDQRRSGIDLIWDDSSGLE